MGHVKKLGWVYFILIHIRLNASIWVTEHKSPAYILYQLVLIT